MVSELMAVGVLGAGISVASFGGAVRETFHLSSHNLKRVWDDVIEEPVPERFKQLLASFEGDGGSND